MILASVFCIVLFMSAMGAMSWLMLLLGQIIMRVKFPHLLYVVLAFFFIVPIKLPYLQLLDPDPNHAFRSETILAARVWITVAAILMLVTLLKAIMLRLSVRKFTRCTEQTVLAALEACARRAGLKRAPVVFYGPLRVPACVVSCFPPAIMLSQTVVRELSADELDMILLHECIHLKRLHLPLKIIFNLLCCLHWFNPLAWIARHEFSLSCELDCDEQVVRKLPAGNGGGYAKMLMRLLELSFPGDPAARNTLGILVFREMKQRIKALLLPASKARRACAAIACALILCVTVWSSLSLSRGFFYPYPAYLGQREWSVDGNSNH